MTLPLLLDQSLIQKYDSPEVPGPLFPAPELLRERASEAAYREQVDISNGDPIPRQLSVNLTLPMDVTSALLASASAGTDSLACLAREIAIKGRLFDSDRQVNQLHLSGGIPTGGTTILEELLAIVTHHFNVSSVAERVLSVDITQMTPALVARLADMGINRLKVYSEGMDGPISSLPASDICALARSYGIATVDVLIGYGAPKQSPTSLQDDLDTILAGRPDQVTFYRYSTPPRTDIDAAAHPHASLLLVQAVEQVLSAGYSSIGCKSFVPGEVDHAGMTPGVDHCADCSSDWVGLGPGALSRAGDSYFGNEQRYSDYCERLRQGKLPVSRGVLLDAQLLIRRDLIHALSCHGGLDLPGFEQRHGVAFPVTFAQEMKALQALIEDGLVILTNRTLSLSPLGKLLFRSVARVFEGRSDSNVVNLAPAREWQHAGLSH